MIRFHVVLTGVYTSYVEMPLDSLEGPNFFLNIFHNNVGNVTSLEQQEHVLN